MYAKKANVLKYTLNYSCSHIDVILYYLKNKETKIIIKYWKWITWYESVINLVFQIPLIYITYVNNWYCKIEVIFGIDVFSNNLYMYNFHYENSESALIML